MAERDSESLHRLLDKFDSVATFQEALSQHRGTLVKNLNVMSMLINPVSFKHIISEDEQGRIRKTYENNEKEKAAGMFIGALLLSQDQTEWSVFKDALKRSEGNEIFTEILCNGMTESLKNHEADQAQMSLQRGRLAEQWDAFLVANKLLEEQVLTYQEYEEVLAKLHNQGNLMASHHFLTLVTRRKDFLWKMKKVLWELGYKRSVKEMDPDYYRQMKDTHDSSSEGDTSDDNNGNDTDVEDGYITNVDAIGFNYMDLPNGEMKMVNVNMVNQNKNNQNITNNLDVSAIEGPIASRTRSKTKLLQQKDLDESFLKQPVLQDRQPGSPQKPRETIPARQAVIQNPRSYPSHTRKICVQGKDAATQVSIHEDKKLTKSSDYQIPFGNDPDTKSSKPSLKKHASNEEDQLLLTRNLKRYICCGQHFNSQDAFQAHIRLECKEPQNQTAPDVHKPEVARGQQYPVNKTKSEQQTIPSSHMNAGGKIKNDIEITGRQGDCLRTVNTFPQVTERHNALGREIYRQEAMKVSRNAYSHPEYGTRDQTKSKRHNSEIIAHLTETSCREILKQCECGKRFISNAYLMVHRENCPEFWKFTGQTDDRGKTCIEGGRLMPGLKVASNQDAADSHQAIGARVKTKSKIHSTEQIGNLTESSWRELLKPCECGKRFISDADLMVHRENCPEFWKFTGHTDDGGKTLIKAGLVMPGLKVASNQDAANQAHGARVKTKSKIHSTEQIGKLTESNCRTLLKQCVCGKIFISDACLSKHQGQDCPKLGARLNRCSYREDVKQCECGERFMSDADLLIHRENCPEIRKFASQANEDERSVDGGKPCTEAGRVVPGPNVASNQDTTDSQLCGNSFHHQARGESSSLHGAHGLTKPEKSSSAGKRTKSPPNSEYRSLQEGTNRRIKFESPDHLTDSDETVRKTVLKSTVKPNETSNTDVKETYRNTRDLKPNQKEESSSEFGFQSNKTRQLNNEH